MIESLSYSNHGICIQLYRRDGSTSRQKNNMRTATLKSWDMAPKPRAPWIWRPPVEKALRRPRVVPSAAIPKPPSKWTVLAAFILSAVLHVSPVVWVEMQQEKSPVEVGAPLSIHSLKDMTSEKGVETDTGRKAVAGDPQPFR